MSLYLWDGQLLLVDGKLAAAPDCCCEGGGPCNCTTCAACKHTIQLDLILNIDPDACNDPNCVEYFDNLTWDDDTLCCDKDDVWPEGCGLDNAYTYSPMYYRTGKIDFWSNFCNNGDPAQYIETYNVRIRIWAYQDTEEDDCHWFASVEILLVETVLLTWLAILGVAEDEIIDWPFNCASQYPCIVSRKSEFAMKVQSFSNCATSANSKLTIDLL